MKKEVIVIYTPEDSASISLSNEIISNEGFIVVCITDPTRKETKVEVLYRNEIAD